MPPTVAAKPGYACATSHLANAPFHGLANPLSRTPSGASSLHIAPSLPRAPSAACSLHTTSPGAGLWDIEQTVGMPYSLTLGPYGSVLALTWQPAVTPAKSFLVALDANHPGSILG